MYYLLVIYFFSYIVDASNITTCNNPNAKDSFVKVTVTTIDAPVSGEEDKQVVWLAPDYKTVFLVTTGGTLWRSFDSGTNWEIVNLKLNTLGVKSVQLSGDGKGVVVIGNGNSITKEYHWWTSEDGKNFTHSMPPGQMEEVKFHPRQFSWLIAITTCAYGSLDCNLYLSQDSGIHWYLLRTNVRRADWNSDHKDDKFLIVWAKSSTGGVWQDSQLVYSLTFFQTPETVVAQQVLGYKTVGKKIFVARRVEGSSLSLLVSEDSGAHFNTVRFPGGLSEHFYTILDVTEGSTFINVQHGTGFLNPWGNLYSSNALGSDFALSLEKNVRSGTGKCDFKPVAGLEGIYIANRYNATSGQDDYGSGKQTMITYDKGGKWNRLPKPQGIQCDATDPEDCKLNLLGTSDGNSWFTRKEAIGIVLTTGGPSRYLLNVDNMVGVYISRDAGWTWKYVASGRYTYEIGNRGAILLLMTNDHATGTLKYSLDEGDTWVDCVFANGEDQVEVKEIVSDPNMESGMFLAYGSKGDKGILISIDFTNIQERLCKGFDLDKNPGETDYEYWEPSDIRGGDCLLGRRLKYVRRKQTAKCLNPITFKSSDAIFVNNCSCTEENYECDYCFVAVGEQCVPDPDPECSNYDPKRVPENCQGTYFESQGFRRVPGDSCDYMNGGVDKMPIEKNCPNSITPNTIQESSGGRGSLVVFLMITVLLLFLVGMWIFSGYNENIRQLLGYVIPKRFLPEFHSPSATRYSPLDTQLGDDDLEEDAQEIDVDRSDSENPGSVI